MSAPQVREFGGEGGFDDFEFFLASEEEGWLGSVEPVGFGGE